MVVNASISRQRPTMYTYHQKRYKLACESEYTQIAEIRFMELRMYDINRTRRSWCYFALYILCVLKIFLKVVMFFLHFSVFWWYMLSDASQLHDSGDFVSIGYLTIVPEKNFRCFWLSRRDQLLKKSSRNYGLFVKYKRCGSKNNKFGFLEHIIAVMF